MKWQILQNDFIKEDMYGIDGFVTRMEKELRNKGLPLEGFKFLNSPSEMLDFTREIEKEVLQSPEGADLYVGFQTAEKYSAPKIIHSYENIFSELYDAKIKHPFPCHY